MARDKQPFEAASEAAEKAFEQNAERAQGAMDNYLRFLQNMCSPDLAEKMKTYTEQNMSASTDCMHKLSRAKDFPEENPWPGSTCARIFQRFFAFRLSSCRGK